MNIRGWFSNPKRRARRDKPNSFSDKDAEQLITTIEEVPEYVSPILGSDLDMLVRARDKALIATAWIWFKRAGEVLGVKRARARKK